MSVPQPALVARSLAREVEFLKARLSTEWQWKDETEFAEEIIRLLDTLADNIETANEAAESAYLRDDAYAIDPIK